MQVHVFDFDGTIFYSPSPNETAVRRLYGHQMLGQLRSPVQSGGLGWFQSLSSMSPPVVPHAPDVQSWYVEAVLRRMHELGASLSTTHTRTSNSSSSTSKDQSKESMVRLYVMTGRDVKYRARITHLLQHAGVLPYITEIFLKPHETAGTIRYKLDTLAGLIQRHQPRELYYYEDRPDQGGRLLEGMRCYQRELHPTLLPRVAVMVLDEGSTRTTANGEGNTEEPLLQQQKEEESSAERDHNSCVAKDVSALQEDNVVGVSEARTHDTTQPSCPTTHNANHTSSTPRYISVQELFGNDRAAQRRAERQAEEWVMRSFAPTRGRNTQVPHNTRNYKGRCNNAQNGAISSSALAAQATSVTSASVPMAQEERPHESSPAPFTFTLVMMPEQVQSRSATMLGDAELQMLVTALQAEKAQSASPHSTYA